MAHGTFGDNDSEAAANATYVASVKRQKAIRRCIKLFFRLMAALAIIILAALVIILALALSDCRNTTCVIDTNSYNRTCDGINAGNRCLTLKYPDTWTNANERCKELGQRLPKPSDNEKYPWLTDYLVNTWGNINERVFGTSGGLESVTMDGSTNKYFCVDDN
ncbi:ORF109 EEV glycoprotein [Bovine papular stomatitis virus]|uniref:Protein OPG161 n=1 Tax=Bovine papular stomatitis virus TaxID=129727 RepID=Q6TV79_9POXV|nr:ORF109 EEV glycoprotein [Bovine papular stomatitis virus]AAR98466.1 ORF109 EEV glycoprotein [Bovine papular stomatitis virus]AKC03277.1 EEV glycoprotein [Bovine papular stomatitis virus]AKC03407.1 EEV glycoprotein [Bovine papular stomatitis virus]